MGWSVHWELSTTDYKKRKHSELKKPKIDYQKEIETIYKKEAGNYDLRWRTFKEDLKEYSLKYPSVLFKVEVLIPEDCQEYIYYFRNGKMQECKGVITVTYPEYDENKLI